MTHALAEGKIRVLVCGASPDGANHNANLRGDVAEGFAEVLGASAVAACRYEAAARQIRRDRPEVALVFGSCLPDRCEYAGIRKACDASHSQLVFWLHDDPYEFDSYVKAAAIADTVFSNDRWAAAHYPRENVFHLPLGANPRRFANVPLVRWEDRVRDVFFCGVGFPNRRQLLEDLSGTLARCKTEVFGTDWPVERLAFCRNERLDSAQLSLAYASSRVVLNMGRSVSLANNRYQLDASTPGPRTFEASMAGCCQLLFADSLEVLDYFDLGQEILLFNDTEDFRAQLAELLADGARTCGIGAAARRRALRDHTFAARAQRLLECIGMAPPVATVAPVFAPAPQLAIAG